MSYNILQVVSCAWEASYTFTNPWLSFLKALKELYQIVMLCSVQILMMSLDRILVNTLAHEKTTFMQSVSSFSRKEAH